MGGLEASKRLFARARRVMPSGVSSPVRYFEPYPIFVKRADGSLVWDADDRKYVDFCNGYGALLLGHRRREIISAVTRQLARGTLYCAPTRQEAELSELIRDNFPSMEKIRLVNTGSEATMTAIRLARGFTGKKKIIKFEGCYHGAHDSVLVKAGSGSAHSGISVSGGGLEEVSRNTLVVRYNSPGDLEAALVKNDGSVAGVIIEPILANMGLIPPKKNFLRDVRRMTKSHGVPLIFDEVVTGLRVSPGGAQQLFGVRPDITTLAKALGGGFAIAAVGGRREIMDMLSPRGDVYQASTFAGNPVSVSAAISSVRTINRLGSRLYSKMERNCAALSSAVDDAATEAGVAHQVNRISSMMQIFFSNGPVVDYSTSRASDQTKFDRMFHSLLKQGVFIAPSQFEAVFLSYAHTSEDLDLAGTAYRKALEAVRG